jgi:monovalent cation:H+ antiporter-2, CPA2 family
VHDTPLLSNVAVALGAAFVGGFVARIVGVPAIVGYLLAGMAIGPHTPGFVGDVKAIRELAELGVIFLMFGVGLHFSLKDLWRVRAIAIPGGIAQMALATAFGYGLGRLWGWSPAASLLLGLSLSIASTVVLLRGLMDEGLLDSAAGRAAVGWLVLEDIATVVLLLLLPALAGGGADTLAALGPVLLKAGLFVGLMLLFGARIVPRLLLLIARTRSRELFLLVVLAASAGLALLAAQQFGVSLALGAFLAGVVVHESPLSHQVGADLMPFREAFAVLFFVSVGMLVDPAYVWAHAGEVAALTALVVLGKAFLAFLICLLLAQPLRTGLVVAAGLAQMGEFSFILGQAGTRLGFFSGEQYGMLLAGALFSITLNPLLFRLVRPLERAVERSPLKHLLRERWKEDSSVPRQGDHVVVVGCGRVGEHIVDVLGRLGVPRLVVESDPGKVEELQARGLPVLFGDAANSEILDHAGLERARALVVTLPDEPAVSLVVAAARRKAPALPIVARAATRGGVRHLQNLGASDVIHPELEGGLEVVRHTLRRLGFPLREVLRYADLVRAESYDTAVDTDAERQALRELVEAGRNLEIRWLTLPGESPFAGRTLAETQLRKRTGASVVAIVRDHEVLPAPAPDTPLRANDRLGLIGEEKSLETATALVTNPSPA